jgi:hypothetical protein
MKLSQVLVFLVAGLPALAQPPVVTATKWVDYGKNRELLRKINGRWWSQDNREVYPPSKGGVFWELDSKPGVCEFFHHRPFQLSRAESLHLWMKPDEVQAVLGPPNRIFGTGDHAFWYYYAADGTKLDVRFMGDGGLGEANYSLVGEKGWPVASIARELNGRSIYSLLQERATTQSHERFTSSQALVGARLRRGQPSMTTLALPSGEPQATPAPKRTISAGALAALKPGASRQDVLNALGEPLYRSGIAGDADARESFTYYLDSGQEVVIRLVNGMVTEARTQ